MSGNKRGWNSGGEDGFPYDVLPYSRPFPISPKKYHVWDGGENGELMPLWGGHKHPFDKFCGLAPGCFLPHGAHAASSAMDCALAVLSHVLTNYASDWHQLTSFLWMSPDTLVRWGPCVNMAQPRGKGAFRVSFLAASAASADNDPTGFAQWFTRIVTVSPKIAGAPGAQECVALYKTLCAQVASYQPGGDLELKYLASSDAVLVPKSQYYLADYLTHLTSWADKYNLTCPKPGLPTLSSESPELMVMEEVLGANHAAALAMRFVERLAYIMPQPLEDPFPFLFPDNIAVDLGVKVLVDSIEKIHEQYGVSLAMALPAIAPVPFTALDPEVQHLAHERGFFAAVPLRYAWNDYLYSHDECGVLPVSVHDGV